MLSLSILKQSANRLVKKAKKETSRDEKIYKFFFFAFHGWQFSRFTLVFGDIHPFFWIGLYFVILF